MVAINYCLSLQNIFFSQLVPVMQQPDGVSVHYLCYKMQNLAWKKYVIARKSETGTTDKVLYVDMQIRCIWEHTVRTYFT